MKRKIDSKIKTILILICLVFLHSGHPVIGHSDNGRILEGYRITLQLSEYKDYIKNHTPIDRLYIDRETICLLANADEVNRLEQAGVGVLDRKPVYSKSPSRRIQNGDYNGLYHSHKETESFLSNLENRFPGKAKKIKIGTSIENRDISLIKISADVGSDAAKPNVYIVGCHHAREWISVEVPLKLAEHLLIHSDSDSRIQQLLSDANIYICPMLNPDGLEYTIHHYRYWRKNRRYNGNFLWGVDLNRNYGYKWGLDNEGSSPYPASGLYRGSSAFSEPETSALKNFIEQHPPAGLISYHNYSQIIIMPWGHTYEPAEDKEELTLLASEMSDRMYAVNGRRYEYGASELLYLVNGDTIDWVYGTYRVPAFTIELPHINSYSGGFVTDEREIELSFSENLPALLYFMEYSAKRYVAADPGSENREDYSRERNKRK